MISIIIPVYNTAKYLDQCLESVFRQSYTDWECIVVDDGSTDGSGAICDKWAMEDARIRVIHQNNSGVSIARNRAIYESSGEYICFVDADDWLDSSFLEVMYNHVGTSQLVVSGQCREYSGGQYELYYPSKSVVFNIKDDVRMFVELNKKSLLYAPHEKLYRTNIIKERSIGFPRYCNFGEDLIFNYLYLDNVDSISCVDKAMYHYRVSNNSLSTAFRPNQFKQDYEQWIIQKKYYEAHGLLTQDAKEFLYNRLWGIIYDSIFSHSCLGNSSNLNDILEIPEIEELNGFKSIFNCSKWIKWAILNRCSLVFSLYFRFIKNRTFF